jgi:hypothetical protein
MHVVLRSFTCYVFVLKGGMGHLQPVSSHVRKALHASAVVFTVIYL